MVLSLRIPGPAPVPRGFVQTEVRNCGIEDKATAATRARRDCARKRGKLRARDFVLSDRECNIDPHRMLRTLADCAVALTGGRAHDEASRRNNDHLWTLIAIAK
jgi:hypothetical protein